MSGPLRLALPAVFILLATMAGAAETRQAASFNVEIRGITVGQLSFSAVENDRHYAVSGTLRSSGLAGMVRKMRYDATVSGTRNGGRLAPVRYEQTGGQGKRHTEEIVTWSNGLPRIEKREPPRHEGANVADPARQKGTVDTLTTIYATLRDVPRGQECRTDVIIYDGRYRMQLRLTPPRTQGATITCNGEYVRLAGFSAAEMAERTRFPFTVHYAPLGADQMRVTQVVMDSLYGAARLVRR